MEVATVTAVTEAVTPTVGAARRTAFFLWLSLAVTLGAAVLGGLYFAIGGIFGPLSDIAGGLMGVTVILSALALRRLMASRDVAAAGMTVVIGMMAGVLVIASSAGLTISSGMEVPFGWTFLFVQFLGMAGIGAWVLSASVTARELFRRRTVVTGVVSGGSYLLVGLGEPIMGFTQTLTYTAGSLGILSFILWVVFATRDVRRFRG